MPFFKLCSGRFFDVCCVVSCANCCEQVLVGGIVRQPKDVAELLGLLLVLLQDLLPLALEQEFECRQHGVGPRPLVPVACTLSFGSSRSMWAPLARC